MNMDPNIKAQRKGKRKVTGGWFILFSNFCDFSPISWQLENIDQYKPSEFHPIHLRDKLCGKRHEIVQKLGADSYTTIWLAWDIQKQQWVSQRNIWGGYKVVVVNK
jgi:hypothetical protein